MRLTENGRGVSRSVTSGGGCSGVGQPVSERRNGSLDNVSVGDSVVDGFGQFDDSSRLSDLRKGKE